MAHIQVTPADHTVEEEQDRILSIWEAGDGEVATPKKKGGRKTKVVESAPVEQVSSLDTPQISEEERAVMVGILSKPVGVIGRKICNAKGLKPYTDEEAEAVADAGADVIVKYMPELVEYAPEIKLIAVAGSQIMDRLERDNADNQD